MSAEPSTRPHVMRADEMCVDWCEACAENRARGYNPDGTVPDKWDGVERDAEERERATAEARLVDRLRELLPSVPEGADEGEVLAHVADAIRDRDRLARRVRVLEEREARIVAIAGGRA